MLSTRAIQYLWRISGKLVIMLIIRPFGMTLEIAHRIIQAWNDETGEDNFIDEWCGEELDIIYQREKLVSKLRVYRTPEDIASFQRGWHDAIARQRPLAYLDYHGCLVNIASTMSRLIIFALVPWRMAFWKLNIRVLITRTTR